MKLNKYFLIGAMGLGLFACSDDLNDENGRNGNNSDGKMANVSIKFDFNGTRSRAVEDLPTGDYDDNGTQSESLVNTLRIIVTDEDGTVEYNQLYKGTEGDDKLPDGINGTQEPYEGSGTIKFKIPTGAKVFYAYVNEEEGQPSETGTAANASDLKVAVGQLFTNAIKAQDATYFSAESKFHMSGLVKQTVTEVAEESTNDVTINVDRTVAKVQLRLASTYNNDEATNKVKLTKLTAGIGNADLKFKQTDSDDKLWGTYRFANDGTDGTKRMTPYYNEIPTTDNYANVYIRSNNTTENEQDDLLTKSGIPQVYPTHTYYCLENTHATYKKGNTTFVQITATMIPNATVKFNYTAATGNVNEKVEIVKGSDIETADTPETFYLITKVNDPADTEKDKLNTYIWKRDVLDMFSTDGFVNNDDKKNLDVNTEDGKIKAVRNALERRNYEFTEAYVNGVGYFYKAVNDMKDANGKYINKAPVFRNHWYDLTINSIKLPGSPAPDFGGNEDLHPDTDVEMTVKIRQWNKVGHTVDLE